MAQSESDTYHSARNSLRRTSHMASPNLGGRREWYSTLSLEGGKLKTSGEAVLMIPTVGPKSSSTGVSTNALTGSPCPGISRESPALLKLYSNHLGILLNSFNSPKGLNVWTLKSGICRLFLYCPIYFLYCAIPPPRNSPAICFNQGGRGMEQERKRGDSISINTSKTLLIYFRIHWLICHPYSAVNALLWMF